MGIIWVNGQWMEDSAPCIWSQDTGLLHAAGVFTTMRAYAGKVFRLPQHLQRLRRSCQILFIPLTYTDEVLTEAVNHVLHRNELGDARLRLTVTRGRTRQDPLHGLQLSPTVLLTATAFEPYPLQYYERGMGVIVLDEQKLNPYDVQAGHKTLNYLSRFFALREAADRGAGEALWFDVHNLLQGGSISNVFVVKEQVLMSPPTAEELQDRELAATVPYQRSAVLPGITRQAVIELAGQNGIRVRRCAITINQLLEADEVFLTNTAMGIMPVCRIERHFLSDRGPGPVTQRLMHLYEQEIDRSLRG